MKYLIAILVIALCCCMYEESQRRASYGDYQLYISNDSAIIMDGTRFVGSVEYDSTAKFDQIIDKDNE